MSFILEALKKSENKRRIKSGQSPRTIHEPAPRNYVRSRVWVLGVLILLVVNAALLLWVFPSRQQSPPQTTETVSVDVAPAKSAITEPLVLQKRQPSANDLPVPRNDKKIYSFGQLPVVIQRKIPPLQMSLHAYNREDATASLVQLSDRMMREGDMVTDNIRLEQITADGAVLHYDGYRFLLPRRGN